MTAFAPFIFAGSQAREMGNNYPLFFIAGPCVIESRNHALEMAVALKQIFADAEVPLIFKASFDKANRSSGKSYRGPGVLAGLEILAEIREITGLPIITDIHSPDQAAPVAEVADMLQTPAFLCRQTDIIEAAAATGRPLNIKKGQFMSPWEMENVLLKAMSARAAGEPQAPICLCERGVSFGYNNLVVDMRSLEIMKRSGAPVIFDATHSIQLPGKEGLHSGGEREYAIVLARAATAVGIAGIFLETHTDPDHALCDGPNMIPLHELAKLLNILKKIDVAAKEKTC